MNSLPCQERTGQGAPCYLPRGNHRRFTVLGGPACVRHIAVGPDGKNIVWITAIEEEQYMIPTKRKFRVVTDLSDGTTFWKVEADSAHIEIVDGAAILTFQTVEQGVVAAFRTWENFAEITDEDSE